MTALMFAVKVGSFDVVKLLVENSANLFAKNSVSLVMTFRAILGYSYMLSIKMSFTAHTYHSWNDNREKKQCLRWQRTVQKRFETIYQKSAR